MPRPRISGKAARQEKCRRREQEVLLAAQDIVGQDGFLGLKMSDLARAVGISVGTLYVHFESKEDLIVRLATEAWQGRLSALVSILRQEGLRQEGLRQEGLGESERLVATVFVDFLFSVHHPGLFAAEQLASTPSVVDAASERRVEDLFNVHEDIVDVLMEAAELAIEAGEFGVGDGDGQIKQGEETLARAIDRGIWTLMVGNSYIWHTGQLWGDDTADQVGIPDLVRRTTQALFVGLGWISEDPRRDMDRIANFCLQQKTASEQS